MKTILEWFEGFPEPIKTMAIENMNVPKPGGKYPDKRSALFAGFKWRETQQDSPFWRTVVYGLGCKYGWKRIISELEKDFPEIMDKYKEPKP